MSGVITAKFNFKHCTSNSRIGEGERHVGDLAKAFDPLLDEMVNPSLRVTNSSVQGVQQNDLVVVAVNSARMKHRMVC
ncbi:hypothetical protein Plhal304r1_c012g0045481 [Plasmopara halstedii]